MITDTARKIGVLYAIAALLLVTMTGGSATVGAFHDRADVSAQVSTVRDFTADLGTVGNAAMDPTVLRDGGNHTELRITFDVPDARNVTEDESRVTFQFTDHGGTVEAADLACDTDPGESAGTCTVTFEKRDILLETVGTGNRSFGVRGWWTYGRDFVLNGTIRIEDEGFVTDSTTAGNAGADTTTAGNAGGTAGNVATDATTAGNTGTCAGDAGNTGCSGDSNVVEHVALPAVAPGRTDVASG